MAIAISVKHENIHNGQFVKNKYHHDHDHDHDDKNHQITKNSTLYTCKHFSPQSKHWAWWLALTLASSSSKRSSSFWWWWSPPSKVYVSSTNKYWPWWLAVWLAWENIPEPDLLLSLSSSSQITNHHHHHNHHKSSSSSQIMIAGLWMLLWLPWIWRSSGRDRPVL